ncbi:MAG: DUF2808 domain-containing protein [Phormidesmis sp. CAN_BIN44]|nr:DUF2808 domain-containing protein [Phormidesmis sp. CAN_BIN44]
MVHKITDFKCRLIASRLGTIALSILVPSLLVATSAKAGQLAGRSYFDHAPRLIRTAASFADAYTPSSYEFTVRVPEDAGASLQAIKLVQEKNTETLSLNVGQSYAFLGDSYAGGAAVSLASIGGEATPGEATFVFDPPIVPGQTVTIALNVVRNPALGGVYQYGVTAYPSGDNRSGLFLGVGRFNLYNY